MKKRLLSLALALVMVCGLLPVTATAAATVTEIVPPKYDRVEDAYNGLAAVNVGGHYQNGIFVGGKWGFIDATGKEVVPCQHSNRYDAPEFHEGLARVQPEGKGSGFIDTTGKEVVPCKYYDVGNFSEGLAAVELDDKWGFIDTTGKEVVPCKYNHNNSYFYNPPEFHDGRAAVQDENYKWGFIDTTGKEVVPCQYDDYDAPEFHNGLAVVEGSTGQMKNGKTIYAPGVIDTQGNVVVAFGKYHYVGAFSESLAAVRIGDNANTAKWGFINTTGKEVVPCKYDDVNGGFEDWGGFSEGLAAVRVGDNETGKWGFIDTTGKEVVPCTLEYDEVENFSDDLAAVAVNVPYNGFKYGFIDKTGAEVIPCKYDGIYDWESMSIPVPEFHEGLAVVQTSNGWGCIDLHGNEVVPCQYGGAKLLSEGLVAVKVDDKWGVLQVEGLPTEPKPAPAPTPTPTPQQPTTPVSTTAYASTQTVTVDGKPVTFYAYALKDANGNDTNYIKLRDVAQILNGSAAQFQVGYDGSITITTKTAYTPNGTEMVQNFTGNQTYAVSTSPVTVNGQPTNLEAITLTDASGGGYTYFKLRDLGQALGFNVGWNGGIFIESDKPYNANN